MQLWAEADWRHSSNPDADERKTRSLEGASGAFGDAIITTPRNAEHGTVTYVAGRRGGEYSNPSHVRTCAQLLRGPGMPQVLSLPIGRDVTYHGRQHRAQLRRLHTKSATAPLTADFVLESERCVRTSTMTSIAPYAERTAIVAFYSDTFPQHNLNSPRPRQSAQYTPKNQAVTMRLFSSRSNTHDNATRATTNSRLEPRDSYLGALLQVRRTMLPENLDRDHSHPLLCPNLYRLMISWYHTGNTHCNRSIGTTQCQTRTSSTNCVVTSRLVVLSFSHSWWFFL